MPAASCLGRNARSPERPGKRGADRAISLEMQALCGRWGGKNRTYRRNSWRDKVNALGIRPSPVYC